MFKKIFVLLFSLFLFFALFVFVIPPQSSKVYKCVGRDLHDQYEAYLKLKAWKPWIFWNPKISSVKINFVAKDNQKLDFEEIFFGANIIDRSDSIILLWDGIYVGEFNDLTRYLKIKKFKTLDEFRGKCHAVEDK